MLNVHVYCNFRNINIQNTASSRGHMVLGSWAGGGSVWLLFGAQMPPY